MYATLTQEIAASATAPNRSSNPVRAVVLSSSLLTDRMLLYTDFLAGLCEQADVKLWATSANNPRHEFLPRNLVEPFPQIRAYKEFPYNYLRRLNDFAWDYRLQPPSRISMNRHFKLQNESALLSALRIPARLMSAFGVEEQFEDWLEKRLLAFQRSEEALQRLQAARPDVLLTTGTFRFEEPAINAAAKNLGIPTLAFITSWDNPSTKNRMVFKYDGYLVWSEEMKQELYHFFPHTREVPVYVVGAPQFDVFLQPRFHISREAFCAQQGLRTDLPIILYALGSPNFLKEHHGAIHLAERVARGELGDVQMLVRPHPLHDNGKESQLLNNYGDRVIVQRTGETGTAVSARSQDERQITEWVNTFRHADVVVNLSSTVAIDAAFFDKPVVNLDYDPQPGQPDQALIKDINHLWTHFKPIAESGGVWLVNNPEEKIEAVKTYLQNPALHRERRRWMVEHVCGFSDGRCGHRMAEALLDFAQQRVKK